VLSSSVEQADYHREMSDWAFGSFGAYNVYYVKLNMMLWYKDSSTNQKISKLKFQATLSFFASDAKYIFFIPGYLKAKKLIIQMSGNLCHACFASIGANFLQFGDYRSIASIYGLNRSADVTPAAVGQLVRFLGYGCARRFPLPAR
jgi:hypothetical protein